MLSDLRYSCTLLRILKLTYFFWNSVSSIPLISFGDYRRVESSSQPFGSVPSARFHSSNARALVPQAQRHE
jgi:hypothetical protein